MEISPLYRRSGGGLIKPIRGTIGWRRDGWEDGTITLWWLRGMRKLMQTTPNEGVLCSNNGVVDVEALKWLYLCNCKA